MNNIITIGREFARTLLFQIATILIMPMIWKLNGIWLSVFVPEAFALIVTIVCYITKKKKYQY